MDSLAAQPLPCFQVPHLKKVQQTAAEYMLHASVSLLLDTARTQQQSSSAHLDGTVALCCCVHLPLDAIEGDGCQAVFMGSIDNLDDFHRHGCVLMLCCCQVKQAASASARCAPQDRWQQQQLTRLTQPSFMPNFHKL
jgi:hypothetical protein